MKPNPRQSAHPNVWTTAFEYSASTYVPAKWQYGQFVMLLFDTLDTYVIQDGSSEVFQSRWKVIKEGASWNEAVHVSNWEWA